MTLSSTAAFTGRFLPCDATRAEPRRPRCPRVRCCRALPECFDGERLETPSSSSGSSSSSSWDGSSYRGPYGRRAFLASTAPLLLSLGASSRSLNSNASPEYAPEGETDLTSIVRAELRKVLSKAKAAGALRLAFHDAGTFDMNDNTGGMNGSIILELDRPENAGLNRSVKALGKAKSELDKVQDLSWADLIAAAGSEAVALCGGPFIPVQFGRVDASSPDPEGKLPEETLGAADLKKSFSEKGFTTQELVVLSGAHTLGGKGFGSPVIFDNAYYKVLLERPWAAAPPTGPSSMSTMIGIQSDHALVEDTECLRWINIYAADQERFFDDFKKAYIKLVNTGASWRDA
ncbi:ascorbate peroxidase 6 isoform X2 [Wolffia australiana]